MGRFMRNNKHFYLLLQPAISISEQSKNNIQCKSVTIFKFIIWKQVWPVSHLTKLWGMFKFFCLLNFWTPEQVWIIFAYIKVTKVEKVFNQVAPGSQRETHWVCLFYLVAVSFDFLASVDDFVALQSWEAFDWNDSWTFWPPGRVCLSWWETAQPVHILRGKRRKSKHVKDRLLNLAGPIIG